MKRFVKMLGRDKLLFITTGLDEKGEVKAGGWVHRLDSIGRGGNMCKQNCIGEKEYFAWDRRGYSYLFGPDNGTAKKVHVYDYAIQADEDWYDLKDDGTMTKRAKGKHAPPNRPRPNQQRRDSST
ncbi:hypothetical protein Fcan01_08936 [Folsomia candida]|uniref:Uncharacterized protein n=1 Tax=Folsomia candida TaxID=158441 RepID=A0A226ED46_FOLCA|nr:hypothetical protein Fcan01_08936 [Folsomia candida]